MFLFMRKIKTQLTIANNFIFSIENDEKCVILSESYNIKTMINDEADEVIKELSNLFKIISNQWKVVSFSSIMFTYCLINII